MILPRPLTFVRDVRIDNLIQVILIEIFLFGKYLFIMIYLCQNMFTGLNRFLLVFRDETNLVYLFVLVISLAQICAFIFGTIKLVIITTLNQHTGHMYYAIL